jgi:predicted nucleic acid-binding protein
MEIVMGGQEIVIGGQVLSEDCQVLSGNGREKQLMTKHD